MYVLTRCAVVLATLAAILLGSACTTVVTGSPAADPAPAPTEGPGSDPVAWTDRVCAAMLAFTSPAMKQPSFGSSPDLQSIQKTLSDYLGTIVAGLQQGSTQLGAVGRSPVAGGDDAVTSIKDELGRLERDISAAKAKVDQANPADPAGFQAALADAEATLNAIATPDALSDLSNLPRLQRAAERSASCQQLSAQVAALPSN